MYDDRHSRYLADKQDKISFGSTVSNDTKKIRLYSTAHRTFEYDLFILVDNQRDIFDLFNIDKTCTCRRYSIDSERLLRIGTVCSWVAFNRLKLRMTGYLMYVSNLKACRVNNNNHRRDTLVKNLYDHQWFFSFLLFSSQSYMYDCVQVRFMHMRLCSRTIRLVWSYLVDVSHVKTLKVNDCYNSSIRITRQVLIGSLCVNWYRVLWE
jgi:hypothetical protein